MSGRGARATKQPKSCHERALGLLAVRPRSRRELQQRLLGAGFDASEVDEVLGRLQSVGLVDDEAFARQVAEHQLGVRRAGLRAVERSLAQKGVAPETVHSVLAGASQDEEERAIDLARSRVGRLKGVEPTKAFSRLSSLLMRRGYAPDLARRAARTALSIDATAD